MILGMLIFLNNGLGPNVTKFEVVGTVLEWLGGIGIIVSAVSIRSSLTPVPLPKERGKLSIDGLYRFVRHPMYTSVLILALGIAILGGSVIKYGLVACLVLLFHYKASYEEKYLSQKYPGYEAYAENTPRFIPRVK